MMTAEMSLEAVLVETSQCSGCAKEMMPGAFCTPHADRVTAALQSQLDALPEPVPVARSLFDAIPHRIEGGIRRPVLAGGQSWTGVRVAFVAAASAILALLGAVAVFPHPHRIW